MRLIDADALVDDGLRFQDGYDYDGIMMVRLWDVTKSIRNAPTIDAVPVVRCGDCKHRYVDGDNVRYNVCELNHNRVQSDDWFCADGERKDGDGDG